MKALELTEQTAKDISENLTLEEIGSNKHYYDFDFWAYDRVYAELLGITEEELIKRVEKEDWSYCAFLAYYPRRKNKLVLMLNSFNYGSLKDNTKTYYLTGKTAEIIKNAVKEAIKND